MHIEWNRVTWYSQMIAILLFVGVFFLGFWLGTQHALPQPTTMMGRVMVPETERILANVTYACDKGKTVRAIYRELDVELLLSDGRHFALPQAVSGSGARYANKDESIVFWSKGTTAFMTEGSSTTFSNCTQTPEPL